MAGEHESWMKVSHHTHPQFIEEKERLWNGDFFFVQGADTQFGFIDRYILNLEEPNWDKEIQLTRDLVKKINSMTPKPKFFVICGDLCDAFPDETPELRAKQEASLKRVLGELDPGIILVCVCGNHDCGNEPTYQSVDMYRSSFGDDYFSFWAGGLLFIVLNSQYYMDGSQIETLVQEQEAWLDKQLELSRRTKHGAVLFQHIPWFLDNPEAKDTGYYSIPYETRMRLLDKLVSAGVRYVFCGHYHRNSGGFYKGLEVVVTSAVGGQLGTDKSGARIVKVTEDKLHHEYYAINDLPNRL